MSKIPTIHAATEARKLDVLPDMTDLRDRYYRPALIQLDQTKLPQIGPDYIRNQHGEGACTGFALAAVVDQQCRHLFGDQARKVSTRMLYEMAKLHDDTPGQNYSGSTIRGALKGFYHNGVCLEENAAFFPSDGNPEAWELSVQRAREAREITLGAYYRLHHEINDYHTAINEAGAIIASAEIHSGWANPEAGVIAPVNRFEGRHAFAIVGYDRDGFIIQNSFGRGWGGYLGQPGLALWSYADWAENVVDAWALRLAISSPNAFEIKFARNHARLKSGKAEASKSLAPRRQDINGHFLHIDDGDLFGTGRYASTPDGIAATAKFLSDPQSTCNDPDLRDQMQDYQHAVIITHGAMQDKFAVAKRIRAWKPVFKRNGIYPIHVMWETVFNTEINDVIKDLLRKAKARMGTSEERIDEGLEALARPLGRKLWRDLVRSGEMGFGKGSQGAAALHTLLKGTQNRKDKPLKLHFISHSAGVHLLFSILPQMKLAGLKFETCSLMSPACSAQIYKTEIKPHIGTIIQRVNQYSLIDARERADSVDVYSKSLLYLVTNAIADQCGTQVLGMETSLTGDKPIALAKQHRVYFAGRDNKITNSKTHRGFDSDRTTMNHVLGTILGTDVDARTGFSDRDLTGY